MSDQWIRKAQLLVGDGKTFLDLSELRFRFETQNSDKQTPNTVHVRVYNLSKQTAEKIGKEYSTIVLQAGYQQGNFGAIFFGSIKQTGSGKERNVDSFVDIWAADGDIWYNGALLNKTIAAGASQQDIVSAIVKAQAPGAPQSTDAASPSPYSMKFATDAPGIIGAAQGVANTLARGKVLFGLARDYARDWARNTGLRWSIQNGELTVVPITGYRPGEAVVLSSTTGLVGVPVATEGGVVVRALLNPLIRIGCLVRIGEGDITRITSQQSGLSFAQNANPAASPTTKEGTYRVMQAEFVGDTRGNEWYVDMICLAVDISAAQSSSVDAAG
ncbi:MULTISPECIES: phage protein [unclassified Caballeronia]|uniref:phage protein n=1 Tax=unclassified Caballeronia TaxID=2646786 RepID=UPI002027C61B|nr:MULTISPECIES: hypothetical protein [unclassified Caballeronia]